LNFFFFIINNNIKTNLKILLNMSFSNPVNINELIQFNSTYEFIEIELLPILTDDIINELEFNEIDEIDTVKRQEHAKQEREEFMTKLK